MRLVLAGNLKLAALLGDLVEQPRVLKRNRRLVGKALHQIDNRWRELARLAALQHQCAKRTLAPQQRHDESRVQTRLERGIA